MLAFKFFGVGVGGGSRFFLGFKKWGLVRGDPVGGVRGGDVTHWAGCQGLEGGIWVLKCIGSGQMTIKSGWNEGVVVVFG